MTALLDDPPNSQTLTTYDREHMALYLRLLGSSRDGADWCEAVQILFGLIQPSNQNEAAMCMTVISHAPAG